MSWDSDIDTVLGQLRSQATLPTRLSSCSQLKLKIVRPPFRSCSIPTLISANTSFSSKFSLWIKITCPKVKQIFRSVSPPLGGRLRASRSEFVQNGNRQPIPVVCISVMLAKDHILIFYPLSTGYGCWGRVSTSYIYSRSAFIARSFG